MILDACAFAGPWPFTRLRYRSAEDLVRLMDKAGIDRAAVSPLAGVFYKNCQEANEELFFGIGKNADRLMLVAAINPTYPGWEKDLARSREVLSAVGVRLFPNYHGYELSRPEVGALCERAGEYGIPIFVSLRLQDERHHPTAFKVPAVPYTSVAELARAHPNTRFVLSMGRFGEIAAALKETAQTANLLADVAGVQGPSRCMRRLINEAGSERLLFGTELMLQYPLCARLKMEFSDLKPEESQAVYAGNLARLLSIHA